MLILKAQLVPTEELQKKMREYEHATVPKLETPIIQWNTCTSHAVFENSVLNNKLQKQKPPTPQWHVYGQVMLYDHFTSVSTEENSYVSSHD